jgi:hypothetical protein
VAVARHDGPPPGRSQTDPDHLRFPSVLPCGQQTGIEIDIAMTDSSLVKTGQASEKLAQPPQHFLAAKQRRLLQPLAQRHPWHKLRGHVGLTFVGQQPRIKHQWQIGMSEPLHRLHLFTEKAHGLGGVSRRRSVLGERHVPSLIVGSSPDATLPAVAEARLQRVAASYDVANGEHPRF